MRSPLYATLQGWLFGCVMLLAVNTAWAGSKSSADAPIYDIPRLDGISIDGHGEDWGTRGFGVHFIMDADGHRLTPSDLRATTRLGWNDQGMLVLFDVRDDRAIESDNDGALWSADSVELFLANELGGTDSFQLVCSPGIDTKHPILRTTLYDQRKTAAVKASPLAARAVSSRVSGGYQLEMLLPWSALQITPVVGREVAFQMYINDQDAGSRKKCHWYPRDGAHANTTLMQRLRLAEQSSAPVLASAIASVERFRRIRVDVAATSELVGKTVKVRNGKKVLGSGHIQTVDDRNAAAEVTIPLPAPGKPYDALHVDIDGQAPLTLLPIDVDTLRESTIRQAEFRFDPFVFTDATFPNGDFVNASLMEDLIGRYTVHTKFYNAQYQPVTAAETPGRYAAVVTITSEKGTTITRYYTLYRQTDPIKWNELELTHGVDMPKGLGIDPTVAGEQTVMIADFSKWMLADTLSRSEDGAILLAGLAETKPGSGKVTARTDAWGRNERWWAALKTQLGVLQSYKYVSYLPDGYAADTQKRWPLLLVLHGSGERGISDAAFATYFDRYKMVAFAKNDYPCVLIAPHCPPDEWWSPYRLNLLLDQLMQTYRIDPDRVYLTGLSMGGFGTFSFAMEYPERFAAIAPICGGADPGDAPRLQNLPIWVFHGAKDPTVPFAYSQKMVDALKALKADVSFRVYPEGEHDVWTETFNDPQFYQWFFAHTRKK